MVWMDLEMTGLDPEKELIIEIATLVTDGELNILEEGPCLAIKQSNAILSRMDAWNTTTHKASGLTDRVMTSKISCRDAEKATLDFIKIALSTGDLASVRQLHRPGPPVSSQIHDRTSRLPALPQCRCHDLKGTDQTLVSRRPQIPQEKWGPFGQCRR